MAKIYNSLQLNHIEPEIEKILKKNQNGFWRNQSTTSQILTIHKILGVHAKNLEVTLLFVDFSKVFDAIHREEIEQILLTYGLPKETVAVIIMSPGGDTDFFDIMGGMLQEDTLAPYLFIICLDYGIRMLIDLMKENGSTLWNARSRQYPAQTIMDKDYSDDIVLLAHTSAQAKSLLHNLEWAAGGIGLLVNTDKTEYMCFNQRGDISTLNSGSLKLVDKFT